MAVSVPPLEDVDDRGGPGAAQGVRQPAARADDLALAALSAELPHDLHRLRDARCANRLTARLQPAGCIDGNLAVQCRETVRRGGAAFSLLDEPKIFDGENPRGREVVWHLRDLDAFWVEPRLPESPLA